MKSANIFAVVGILVVCGVFVWLFSMPRETALTVAPPVTAEDHVKGSPQNAITVIEYLDFECQACGAYHPVIKKMEAEFGEQVTFVARHFPLGGHRNAMPAALAVEAAGRQGKFWEMHDLLFERQSEWGGKTSATPEVFVALADELGLDMTQFEQDVASEEVRARVEKDVTEGRALGVQGTPSFFLNGTRLQNPTSEEAFRAVLETAIAEAGA